MKSRWCKVAYIKIVQREEGAMDVNLEVWESTAARATGSADRTVLYQMKIMRDIELGVDEGGQYGESLMSGPIPIKDRDDQDEEKTYNLHCRLTNNQGGVASDFDLRFDISDILEVQ